MKLRDKILFNLYGDKPEKKAPINQGDNPEEKQIRVGLVIDEFFGGAGTAFGGYGFLARHHIARYIPDNDIRIDVLRGIRPDHWKSYKEIKEKVDDVYLYRLPAPRYASAWFERKDYDVYLSIELTMDLLKFEKDKSKHLILWIQDPRPWTEWLEIQTVKLFPEECYWSTDIYESVNRMYHEGRVTFVSQGYFLNEKAKELYRLPHDVKIDYLPNPIDIDPNFDVKKHQKKNHVIFIGRIESVKRGWLFCEIAKRLPEYEFFMIGQTFRDKMKNEEIMSSYQKIKNLHFVGHKEGEEKNAFLRDAKVLINTSIHEALPITFLEALSYGNLLVSCRNPEDLTEKFGKYVGQVLGDGFDKVDLFVDAIRTIMENEPERQRLAEEAVSYIKDVHNVERFQSDLRRLIRKTAAKSKTR